MLVFLHMEVFLGSELNFKIVQRDLEIFGIFCRLVIEFFGPGAILGSLCIILSGQLNIFLIHSDP